MNLWFVYVSLGFLGSWLVCAGLLKYKAYLVQPISEFLPLHLYKKGTPSFGGIGIFVPYILTLISYLLLEIFPQTKALLPGSIGLELKFLPIILISFGCGLLDDWLKAKSGTNRGLAKWSKFLILGAGIVSLRILMGSGVTKILLDTWIILCFIAAYGITDGLDGLLGSISLYGLIIGSIFCRFCPSIVVLIGSLSAFLLYNRHPAKLFMGDCGALALGSLAGQVYVESGYNSLTLYLSVVPIINLIAVSAKIFFARLGIRYKLIAPIHHEIERRIGEVNTVNSLLLLTVLASIPGIFLSGHMCLECLIQFIRLKVLRS